MDLNHLREKINISIYGTKIRAERSFKLLSLVVSLFALGVLTYYYGFAHTHDEEYSILGIIRISFLFYIIHYFVKIFYDFNPGAFIRKNWFEGIMVFILIIDGISYTVFHTLVIESFFRGLGVDALSGLSELFIQAYLFVIVATELRKSGSFIPTIKLHPAILFIISFALIIFIGTALLMLPEMTTSSSGISAIDALFTSTSATCVTGLIVLDTATSFSFKGHTVLLILMKVGGINIIAFGAFLALLGRLGVGVKHHTVIEDFVNKESIFSAKGMFGRIVLVSIIIELIGSVVIFLLVSSNIDFLSFGDKVFFALFHSVSAFNNAGFSIFSNGLYNEYLNGLFYFHIIIACLIILGSIGFTTLFDLFDWRKVKARMKSPWKKPHLSSRISWISATILIGAGAIFFFLFEKENTLSGLSLSESIVASFFQSISLRTAGFNTVDLTQMSIPFVMVCLVLMFIGGASSSTAGGIKTSTFSIVILSAYSTIRGKKNIELFKKTVPAVVVFKSHSIFIFALGGILTGIFLLSITESKLLASGSYDMMDIIFEEVSAFSTVGASTGVTSSLSSAGKLIVIVSMFVGRLGTLTVAYALSKKISATNYRYPKESMMVG